MSNVEFRRLLLLEFGKSWIFFIFCPGKSPTFLRWRPVSAAACNLVCPQFKEEKGSRRVFPSLDAQLFMREYSRHHRQGKTLFFTFSHILFFALLRGFPFRFRHSKTLLHFRTKRGGMEGKGTPLLPLRTPFPVNFFLPPAEAAEKTFTFSPSLPPPLFPKKERE